MKRLRCEGQEDPPAVDAGSPALSWNFEPGERPVAIQVHAAGDEKALQDGELLWDSGWVEPAVPALRYRGRALDAYEPVAWRVRWRDAEGGVSPWSDTARWRMGVLDAAGWRGRWIGRSDPLPGVRDDGPTARALNLRSSAWIWAVEKEGDVKPRTQQAQRPGTRYAFSRTFRCGEKVEWAVLRMAVDGTETEVRVNGTLADLVTTSANGGADSWVLPVDLDLKPFLRPGENHLELSTHQVREHEGYGIQATLAIRDEEGEHRILTDDSWSARHAPDGEERELLQYPPMWRVPRQMARLRDDRWGQTRSTPRLRKTFRIEKPVRSAIASVCGLGFCELRLDGRRAGDRELDPAFTNYERRVFYATCDLTAQLPRGEHRLEVWLGNGWYNVCNYEFFDLDLASWRDDPKALVQLRIEYEDGGIDWIVTDETWEAARSPIVFDGVRNGEVYDARLEDGVSWGEVRDMLPPRGRLEAARFPPERAVEELRAVSIEETPRHTFLFTFPRNISGRPRLRVSGPEGTRVVMRCFEAPDNRLQAWTHQGPYQTDTFILRGEGDELYEPRFTYHGFQCIELSGFPGEPAEDSLTAVVVHTDLESAGSFECSSDLLNRIQKATRASFLNNYHGFPTDCPTREKAGWTADAYLAAETGLMNFDAAAVYSKWIDDLLDCRHEDGRIPDIVPTDTWGYNGFFDWDCVIICMPWQLYLYTGDEEILRRTFEAMRSCHDCYYSKAADGILDAGRGDWCPETSITAKAVTVTALLADSARIIARAAARLQMEREAARYAARAREIAASFRREFLHEDGTVANGTQTAQACALYHELVPEENRAAVVEKLVDAVEAADGHPDTGIFGARYLLRVLSAHGRHELACRLVLQKTYPGYGWWMEQGYTTLPESWSVDRSANHIMFGDVSAWFYAHIAGIRPLEEAPGFARFRLEPKACEALTRAKAAYLCPYGEIVSDWSRRGDEVEYRFVIPPGTSAELVLETEGGRVSETLTPGTHRRTAPMLRGRS
ncbi:alpha-L-rhamnosidase [Kiritimatiella glycovorans]|uniref:alpha-L-rhamnosidase n=1 Tax=Kiritimatiella glycovorans TaxID=1307763 RepID=A0A0G3EE69_9BACT|nr:alpha-L-rhamnosidase [Kiritimatiella glycovorans]AKJ64613.1 Alpha-L-rhamnosidase [Kiritimatiella glycovorans]